LSVGGFTPRYSRTRCPLLPRLTGRRIWARIPRKSASPPRSKRAQQLCDSQSTAKSVDQWPDQRSCRAWAGRQRFSEHPISSRTATQYHGDPAPSDRHPCTVGSIGEWVGLIIPARHQSLNSRGPEDPCQSKGNSGGAEGQSFSELPQGSGVLRSTFREYVATRASTEPSCGASPRLGQILAFG
jgi:hypothetical protein